MPDTPDQDAAAGPRRRYPAWRALLGLILMAGCSGAGDADLPPDQEPVQPSVPLPAVSSAGPPGSGEVVAAADLAKAYRRACQLRIPELDCGREKALVAAAAELLGRHVPAPAPGFPDAQQALLLFAVADRWLDNGEEDGFAGHVLRLLGGMDDPDLDEVDAHRAYSADFLDRERTARLHRRIEAGLLDEVGARLGPASGSDAGPEIVVLDFEAGEPRAEQFARRAGFTGDWLPRAWTAGVGDTIYMAFTRDYVDSHLDDERGGARFGHEYVHTQSPMVPGGMLGSLVEERRAEHFSDDRGEYYEVKQFFLYVHDATGFQLLDALDRHPRDGEALYAHLARNLGLGTMLEVMCSFPEPYFALDNDDLSRVAAHLGSRDGVVGRLFDREFAAGRGHEVDARLRARIARIEGSVRPGYVSSSYVHYLRGPYGLPRVADELERVLGGDGGPAPAAPGS